VLVNNSTNISTTNYRLSPQIIDDKNKAHVMCGSSGIVCLLNKSVDSTVRVDNSFLEYNLKDPFKGTHQNLWKQETNDYWADYIYPPRPIVHQ